MEQSVNRLEDTNLTETYQSYAQYIRELFEEMLASQTPRGTKLLRNASSKALHPKLHLLCIKNKFTLFVPYDNSEDYLNSIVD